MTGEHETPDNLASVAGLKQRIIGAVILICAAIIILPLIFDEPHVPSENAIIPIPIAPARPVIQIEPPVAPKFQVFEISETGVVTGAEVQVADDTPDDAFMAEEGAASPEPPPAAKVADTPASRKADASSDNAVVATPKGSAASDQSKGLVVSAKESKPVPAARPKAEPGETAAKKVLDSPTVSNQPVFKNVWMVKLGVFGRDTNAYQLRDKVRALGYPAHTRQMAYENRVLIAVYSGPFVSEREAINRKAQLDKALSKEKIVGIVQNIDSF